MDLFILLGQFVLGLQLVNIHLSFYLLYGQVIIEAFFMKFEQQVSLEFANFYPDLLNRC